MQESFGLQFADHFRAKLAPVFLGHSAVLGQWCHKPALLMQKDQAAGPSLTFCDEQPYNIIIFGQDRKSYMGAATPLAMPMASHVERGNIR
jgi:hypothetical protein